MYLRKIVKSEGIENTDDKSAFSVIKNNMKLKKKIGESDDTEDIEKSLELSNAFISVRNQYENYLNSFVVKKFPLENSSD